MQGVWVQTLVRGIRFFMLHGMAKKKKKKNLATGHLEDEDLENNSFKTSLAVDVWQKPKQYCKAIKIDD